MKNILYIIVGIISLIQLSACREDPVGPEIKPDDPELKTEEIIIGRWNVDIVFGEIIQDTLSYGDILIEFTPDSMYVSNNTNDPIFYPVGKSGYSYEVDSLCWFSFEQNCPPEEKREALFIDGQVNTLQIAKDSLRFGQLYVDGFDYILSRTRSQ